MVRDRIVRIAAALCAALAMVLLASSLACAQSRERNAAADPAAASHHVPAAQYKLGTGDKLRINVFGQTDLDGDYVVDATGNVQLPLVGQIQAAGLTVDQFQKEVTAKLANGFLVNPSVSVQVENYRPFYIMGEVNKPGEYPYVNGMSILNAIALSGGYTFRADDSEVYIRRSGASKEVEYPADETTKIYPGDIIRVPEQFF